MNHFLAISADRAVDELREIFRELRIAKPVARKRTWPAVFYNNIGAFKQSPHDRSPGFLPEIDDYAFLVSIQAEKCCAFASQCGPPGPDRISFEWLNLDYPRAEVREHHRAIGGCRKLPYLNHQETLYR